MIRFKKIFLVVFIVFSCFITGCSSKKKTSQDAIEYLNNKYNKTFHLISYEEDGNNYMIHAYTDGMDKENEYVAVYENSKDKNKFVDNYFGYLIRDDIEAQYYDLLGSKCKVYQDVGQESFPDTLIDGSTIDDLYTMYPNYITSINIYLQEDSNKTKNDYDKLKESLQNWIKKNQRSGSLNLFVVSKEYYQNISRYEQDEFWRYYAENREPDYINMYYVYLDYFKLGDSA